MDQKQNKLELQDLQKGYLTLPIDEENFKDFISGLLGKPQTITKRIPGTFEIHLKDLQNFHELIDQRITQQNNGRLIQLKTKIYYNDNSTVLFSSYEELVTYNEIKPIVSEAVRMSWSYLIKFPDKKVPEKEEIEITMISTPRRSRMFEDDDVVHYSPASEFRIIIQHTARSWGSDIESLLTNQINSILKPKERWRAFLNNNSGKLAFTVGGIIFLTGAIGALIAQDDFRKKQLSIVNTYLQQAGTTVIDKLNYLIKYVASDPKYNFETASLGFFVFILIIAVALGFWVQSLAETEQISYILLTRESLNYKSERERRKRRRFALFLFSFIISILTGIIANLIFGWLLK